MIRIRKKSSDQPSIKFTRGPNKGIDKLLHGTQVLIDFYTANKVQLDAAEIKMPFKSDLYADKKLKKRLIKIQRDKCCFCESKLSATQHGDVEHFRPKAAYKQSPTDTGLTYPGYFWLAYDWDNLFFSCQLCNQVFKKNFFPLSNPHQRMLDPTKDLTIENPMFINPATEDPSKHVTFVEEIPRATADSERGRITIEYLGLDRPELNERRQTVLRVFKLLLDFIRMYKLDPTFKENVALTKHYIEAKKIVRKSKSVRSEYTLMLKVYYKLWKSTT